MTASMADVVIRPAKVSETPSRLRQAVDHNPDKGILGDCYRTAMACLLALDDPTEVPHFVQLADPDAAWEPIRLARHWLRKEHSLDLAPAMLDDLFYLGIAAIVTAPSHRHEGSVHALVLLPNGDLWDPSGADNYTADELIDETGLVVCEVYNPNPDEMIAEWQAFKDQEETA